MGKKVDDAILGTRIGHTTENISVVEENNFKIEGLLLSQIVYKPLDFFIPNPCNTVFENLKTKQQLDLLLKDIDEARAIINPLITMPDGILVEGHSRLTIAKTLENMGRSLGRLPVRIITTPLSDEEVKQRVYLGNLSRFELDEDTKISLYAEIWPDYFLTAGKVGRKSDHGDPITLSVLSEKLGKSIPQIKRDAAIIRNATKYGSGKPNIQDIKKSRGELNEKRKQKDIIKIKNRNTSLPNIPEYNNLEKLFENGAWNFLFDISSFSEYAQLLNEQGYNKLSRVIEYLLARINNNEMKAKPLLSLKINDI